MHELEDRVKQLEATVNQIIRKGVVQQTYPERGTARVVLPDADGLVTYELQVLFKRTVDNKDYDMPDIGEQVVCLFLPNGREQGFVIGSPYSTVDQVPMISQEKKHYLWKDGAFFTYDREFHYGILDMTACDGVFEIKTGSTHIRIEPHHIYLRADRIDENDDR